METLQQSLEPLDLHSECQRKLAFKDQAYEHLFDEMMGANLGLHLFHRAVIDSLDSATTLEELKAKILEFQDLHLKAQPEGELH